MSCERMQEVPLDLIDLTPQVRENPEDDTIQYVAETLKENGQLHPVRLLPAGSRFNVVTGARRVLGARRAGWQSISAIIERADLSEAEILTRQLTENCARKGLATVRTANHIQKLMDMTGMSASQVAGKLGFSVPTVSRLLALLKLPSEVQSQVQSGAIPASTAYEIAKVADSSKQAELAKAAAAGELTREAVTAAINYKQNDTSDASNAKASRGLAKLEGGRSVSVRAEGLTLELFVTCLERVLASARKARRQGVELASFLKAFNAEPRGVQRL